MHPSTRREVSGRSSPRGGFTLLALLLVLSGLSLLVFMSLQSGEDERRGSSQLRNEARALAIAEMGLERTRAYVSAVLAADNDMDRVLDPKLNTDCTLLPALVPGLNQEDDHLPAFTNGAPQVLSGSGKVFYRVAHEDGAYFVRIEDNDDDADDNPLLEATTSNNLGLGCKEGVALGKNNPVRDRDRTVIITVVGIHPGQDVDNARARKVLRVRLGPQPAAGIIAGGTIDMDGAAHVCGAHGDVLTTGGISGGCLCGAGCTKGIPAQSCGAGNACTAKSTTDDCSANNGGSGGVCVPNATVPPPPSVNFWSRTNAPLGCKSPTDCTPFYYLRNNGGNAEVHMWNYALAPVCAQPQKCSRIPYPGEAGQACSACWVSVYNPVSDCGSISGTQKLKQVRMADDVTLRAAVPTRTTGCASSTPIMWELVPPSGSEAEVGSGTCDTSSGEYPETPTSLYGKLAKPKAVFKYELPSGTPVPRGIWMVEGTVRLEEDTPACITPEPVGESRVSFMALGDMVVNKVKFHMRPAHPQGILLLSGRDTILEPGQSAVYACDTSAAVLVHEQFDMGSNSHLNAQLVVENGGKCSTAISSDDAISIGGNATISVRGLPPMDSGGPPVALDWSESSY